MTIRSTPYLSLVVVLFLCCANMQAGDKGGEDVQRLVTRSLAMPITRVDSTSVRDLKVPDFPLGPEFKLVKAPKVPFDLLDTQNRRIDIGKALPMENNVVLFRVAFRPISAGSFRDTIIARRVLPFNVVDEIVVVVEGFSFVPSRTIHVDFRSVLVGGSAQRFVRVTDEAAASSVWTVLRPDPPFSVISPSPQIVPDPDDTTKRITAFVLQFEPFVKGLKKGSATFVRRRSDNTTRVIDTLIVEMSGVGEELLPRDSIEFGRMMTGDINQKQIAIPVPGITKSSYIIAYQPPAGSHFTYIRHTVTAGMLVIEASFEPNANVAVSESDSVVFHRIKEPGRVDPLDSVVCKLLGSATPMQRDTEVAFVNQRLGKVDSVSMTLTIPVAFRTRKFSYTVTPEGTANTRVWGEVIEPRQMPSDDTTIVVRIYSRPKALGTYTDVINLVRSHETVGETDRTQITVKSEVKPRSIQLRASITREVAKPNEQPTYDDSSTMSAAIGDTIVVAILARISDPIDLGLTFSTLRCSLAYNPTVLVPIVNGGDDAIVVDDNALFVFGDASVTTQTPISKSDYVLARASFVAVLGDADNSTLALQGLTLEPRDLLIDGAELDTATVRLTNVWSYQDGRSRLINSLQKQLVLRVAPNPASTGTPITVENVPSGTGRLHIVSTDGVLMADLTANLRQGGVPLLFPDLPRGVYFVRLFAKDDATSAIDSVVRLVIYE